MLCLINGLLILIVFKLKGIFSDGVYFEIKSILLKCQIKEIEYFVESYTLYHPFLLSQAIHCNLMFDIPSQNAARQKIYHHTIGSVSFRIKICMLCVDIELCKKRNGEREQVNQVNKLCNSINVSCIRHKCRPPNKSYTAVN